MKKQYRDLSQIMRHRGMSCTFAILAVGTTFPGSFAVAQQAGGGAYFAIGAIAEHTDNVTRSETEILADTIYGAITDFGWARETQRIAAGLQGNLAYYQYAESDYDTELVGSAAANLAFSLVPERFTWVLEDTFGQARVDETAAVTADNRQNVNIFLTGPRMNLQFGARSALAIEASYTNTEYESSPENNDAMSGRVSLSRRMSARQSVSLNIRAQSVEFTESTVYVDYDQKEIYAGWSLQGSRTRLEIDAGSTILEGFGAAGESTDGTLVRVQIERDLTANSRFILRGRQEVTSSSEAFRLTRELVGGSLQTQNNAIAADPFELRYVGLSYAVASPSLNIEFLLSAQEDRYEVSTSRNRDTKGASLRVLNRFGQRWTAGLFAEHGEEDYVGIPDTGFEFLRTGIVAGVELNQNWRTEFSVGHDERDSTFVTGSYEETYGRLLLSYGFGRRGGQATPGVMSRSR